MTTPNWQPAEQHIPHLLSDVMWMGTEQVHQAVRGSTGLQADRESRHRPQAGS